jgi:hypothetical protein
MHSIFQGAFLTISASKNTQPAESLYSKTSEVYRLASISSHPNDGPPRSFRTPRFITHWSSLPDFPLHQRAWAFQERILSKRVLHFGPSELLWECLDAHTCECGDLSIEDTRTHFIQLVDARSDPLEIKNILHHIIQQYSKLDITFGKDIFPAVSGIIKRLIPNPSHNYLAGLWRENLAEELLWHTPGDKYIGTIREASVGPSARPIPWRAPTWSWASIQAPVEHGVWFNMEKQPFHPSIVVHQASCTPTNNSDATGELTDGRISLSGPIVPVILRHAEGEMISFYPEYSKISLEAVGQSEKYIETIHCRVDYDVWTRSEGEVQDGEQVYCLEVGLYEDAPAESEDERECMCYLILRCVNNLDRIYERIGFAATKGSENSYFEGHKRTATIILV